MARNVWRIALAIAALASSAQAATLTMAVREIDGGHFGAYVGTVTFEDTEKGLAIETNLYDLPPGKRTIHVFVYEQPKCELSDSDSVTAGHSGGQLILSADTDNIETRSLAVAASHLKVEALHRHAVVVETGDGARESTQLSSGAGTHLVACGSMN